MTETVIASVTLTKRLPNRRSFSATAALVHLSGNERPYFSVTGEERNLRRRGDNQVEAGGCMHDEILQHFPQLAPVIALHLADDTGAPMYEVANANYWLGFGDQRFIPENAPDLDKFARLWRLPMDAAENIYNAAADSPNPVVHIRISATWQHARWQAEADAALALIKQLRDEQISAEAAL
jgi:hypothetical protein